MSYDRVLSHSGLETYKKCPALFESVYILKEPKPEPGRAASRGIEFHKRLEEFFLGTSPYPKGVKELRPWQRFMEGLTVYNPSPEKKLSVNSLWEQAEYEDETANFRGILDLTFQTPHATEIYDWKTGKIYEDDHERQGLSYVALSPPHSLYRTNFVYLDLPLVVHTRTYTASDRVVQISDLSEEIARVRVAETFPPTPSAFACRYCHLSWRNGGRCRAAP